MYMTVFHTLNRGSIRKAKLSTDRDNGAISKQGFLISQDSIERVMNDRHNSPSAYSGDVFFQLKSSVCIAPKFLMFMLSVKTILFE